MSSKSQTTEDLVSGIAVYAHEQKVFMRLLRRRQSFTSVEFDRWFTGREYRRPCRARARTGNTFILGIGLNGFNRWAEMLDLLQIMVRLGLVHAKEMPDGQVLYSRVVT